MLERHSTMLNLTARIVVKMQNLPPWDVDWADSRPQKASEQPHMCRATQTESPVHDGGVGYRFQKP